MRTETSSLEAWLAASATVEKSGERCDTTGGNEQSRPTRGTLLLFTSPCPPLPTVYRCLSTHPLRSLELLTNTFYIYIKADYTHLERQRQEAELRTAAPDLTGTAPAEAALLAGWPSRLGCPHEEMARHQLPDRRCRLQASAQVQRQSRFQRQRQKNDEDDRLASRPNRRTDRVGSHDHDDVLGSLAQRVRVGEWFGWRPDADHRPPTAL